MKNLMLVLIALFLAACGSKENVTASGDLPQFGRSGQGQVDPIDPGGAPTASTLIQIACQSGAGITLPNSLMASGQRFIDTIPAIGEHTSSAPAVLGVEGSIISAVFVAGSKIYASKFDYSTHALAEDPVAIGKAGGGSSGIYRELGFSQPRLAATSPNGRFFVVASGGSVSLRSVQNPERISSRWRAIGSFVQPRWDGNEIFVDKNSGGHLRQAIISVDDNGNLLSTRSAPAPLSSSFHQIGLRRFSSSSLIWLEYRSSRAVLRLWNLKSGRVVNYELPNAKALGPGFALIRNTSEETPRVVMNSKQGMHYFTLGSNGSVSVSMLAYPQDTQSRIDNRAIKVQWNPGSVYSAADDTQLFVILPSTFGNNMLFAIDGNFGYRLLGFEACLNPDFYRSRN